MKILIVEDEIKIAKIISDFLNKERFSTKIVTDGRDAIAVFKEYKPSLVVLDINLPNKDGFEICREIKQSSDTPIMFVTARVDEMDQIKGLEYGAIDYITKPFSAKVLTLKVKNLLNISSNLTVNNLVLDDSSRIISINSEEVNLTPNEYNILKFMMKHINKALSREDLVNAMYENEENFIYDRVVDTHVKNIRKKIGKEGKNILTVRNFGYKLKSNEN